MKSESSTGYSVNVSLLLQSPVKELIAPFMQKESWIAIIQDYIKRISPSTKNALISPIQTTKLLSCAVNV